MQGANSAWVNGAVLMAELKSTLEKQMIEAAEPVIQESLKKVELSMRKALASAIIGFLEYNVRFEDLGRDLRITLIHK